MRAPALVVRTECPTCGGPLDFEEAQSAVECDHCGARLLATGRGRLLSYALPCQVSGRDALQLARFRAAPGVAVDTPRLYWTPYFRVTADEIRWATPQTADTRTSGIIDTARELGIDPQILLAKRTDGGDGHFEFKQRRVERSMQACTAGPGAPSLGVRTAALTVELFHEEQARESGVVLAPDADAPTALSRMLGIDPNEAREHLGVRLGIVYFPWWIAAASTGGAIRIDGASGAVSDLEELPALPHEEATPFAPATVGFRPLMCPNCGDDLAGSLNSAAFLCGSCERAWRPHESTLLPVESRSVEGADPSARLLPFWEICDPSFDRPYRAPAFACRRLRTLGDLTAAWERRPHAPESKPGFPGTEIDVVWEPADALALVRMTLEHDDPDRRARLDDAATRATVRLLWAPFQSDGYALRDSHSGIPVPRHLLGLESPTLKRRSA